MNICGFKAEPYSGRAPAGDQRATYFAATVCETDRSVESVPKS